MGILNGNGSNSDLKIVKDYENLVLATKGLQAVGRKIVVTIGSWDMLHIGHLRYLMKAKEHGDILVVGVDSDRGIKSYKGDFRPVVPENERCEMLTYQSPVDFVTIIDDIDEKGKWQYRLIDAIKPDIFVAVEDSYPPEQIEEIRKYCGDVVVLPRQAEETSTSNFIQNTIKKYLAKIHNIAEEL
ncbi:MAG: adenylyltransferase/cytidyltransferase family protein [Patescibacteria group bacterium]